MSQSAKVVRISEQQPWGEIDPPESPAERATHAALLLVADFYVELHRVRTVNEALQLHALIKEVSASVEMVARAALQKSDALCGRD